MGMRGYIGGALASALLACATPVAAGTLYRCEAADGHRTYASAKVPGQRCSVVANYATGASKPTAKPPAAAGSVDAATTQVASAPATPQVSFRTAPAGASLDAPSAPTGATVTRGAVYKYEKDGITHYTNVRPSRSAKVLFSYIETCYACAAKPGVNFGTVALNTQAYADEVRVAASDFGVDEALVRAVIHAESAFNPNALSRKGAQGLMQLIPATAARFSVADPFDAGQNIRGGVEYLAWLLERFDGNAKLATAAYNAGEGAVDRYGGVPPYTETQRYVERVGVLTDRYRGVLAARAGTGASL